MISPDRERRWVPILFLAVLLGGPLQWYAKYRTGDEPYPGLFLPGFGEPGGAGDSLAVVRHRLVAYYPGADSLELSARDFLTPLPGSHRAAFLGTYFRGRLAPAAARERGAWTRSRLERLSPGREADSLAVVTERLIVNPIPVATVVPLRRYVLDLRTPGS